MLGIEAEIWVLIAIVVLLLHLIMCYHFHLWKHFGRNLGYESIASSSPDVCLLYARNKSLLPLRNVASLVHVLVQAIIQLVVPIHLLRHGLLGELL